MNITDAFVRSLYKLSTDPIPEQVYDEARKCVLDLVGAMLGGSLVLRDRMNDYLDLMAEQDGSTVVNFGRRASMQNAVLVNGMCAHVLDIDDGHRYSTVHLSATIIPAVLTVCERFDLAMRDLLRGVIVGYEVGVRLGRCLQPAHRNRGFHSSGTVGTVAAAMGCAAALGFSEAQMKAALSAAVTSAAGSNAAFVDASTLKPYNAGRAGHDGVTAAMIAKVGFVGPDDPLCGTFGWLPAMAETFDQDALTNPGDYEIMGAYHKPYASCRHTHAAIDGALTLRAQYGLTSADVEKVVVRMYKQGIKGHEATDIPTPNAGKMSTPFCVGLAITTGAAGIRSFTDAAVQDPEVKRITASTSVVEDEALTKLVPGKRAANVEVILKDGSSHRCQVDYAKGEPELPMTTEDFRAKFDDLAKFAGKTQAEADRLADAILTGEDRVSSFTSLLR